VILVSVPLSIFGAMLPLFIGLATMNIYTQVGLVTLIGLISKHGILMSSSPTSCRSARGSTGAVRSRGRLGSGFGRS